MQKVDVAIIGAGSAGLSALRQVQKYTDNYVIINRDHLGTKCARVGCMPSKALIVAANDYHRRHVFLKEGIAGADRLHIDIPAVLRHVRALRNQFTNGMIKSTNNLAGDKLIAGRAEIIDANLIRVDDKKIRADKIIIATGSRPKVPAEWQKFKDRIFTSDNIFEQKDLPRRIGVVGLGPIGLEIGQSLSRLRLDVTAFSMRRKIAGITDPQINSEAIQILKDEFPLYFGSAVKLEDKDGVLFIKHTDIELEVDAILAAIGIQPDIQGLGLENLDLQLDERGMPPFDAHTSQIAGLPIFIAGDVNGCRPILHEALDEGFIAGRNSMSQEINPYCRRVPLYVVFSDPEIAATGLNYKQLGEKNVSFVTGKANFSEQSRAMLELRNCGLIHVYADTESARILGAELVCPDAEHLAHQLALGIQNELTVFDMLRMPFYHPTVEEGLRTALRDAAKKLPDKAGLQELSLCDICPEDPLC